MKNDPKLWKTVSSKTILDHDRLQVTEDIVLLPTGIESTYVRHAKTLNDSVAIIAINKQDQILLQREYSYPPNKIMWQLPGGAMEAGEEIKTAANRELAEESGYSANHMKVIGSFYIHNRLSDKKQHVVLGSDLTEHALAADHDEFIESHWIDISELKHMIGSGDFDNINLLAGLNLWFNQAV